MICKGMVGEWMFFSESIGRVRLYGANKMRGPAVVCATLVGLTCIAFACVVVCHRISSSVICKELYSRPAPTRSRLTTLAWCFCRHYSSHETSLTVSGKRPRCSLHTMSTTYEESPSKTFSSATYRKLRHEHRIAVSCRCLLVAIC